ncbi:MAG: bifunctional phosphoglucose/phosphomannose isomerase [Candidatus Colwellbacteria bacterium]
MREAIINFSKQFQYEPKIENAVGGEVKFNKFAFVGMGGSGLVGDLIRLIKPDLDLVVRKGYGLPGVKDLKDRLLICISYSGNTEETLDAFDKALAAGLNLAVITTGGELLRKAKEVGVLYIELPNTDIQPRMSLGIQSRAALALMGEVELFEEIGELAKRLEVESLEKEGMALAEKLQGKVPIIYSSRGNLPLAYKWKINFNETGKIPAFYNAFPELNHNEMNGFNVNNKNRELSKNMAFLFLEDSSDDAKTKTRMQVSKKLFQDRGFDVHSVEFVGENPAERIFNSIVTGDWVAYHTALAYGVEPNEVPLVEEFKKLIK